MRRLGWLLVAACSSGGADTETMGTTTAAPGTETTPVPPTTSTDATAMEGTSVAPTEATGTTEVCHFEMCGDECVSVLGDVDHCGACFNQCDPGEGCGDGLCICPVGQVKCQGACHGPDEPPDDCTGCDGVCGEANECVGGTCVPPCVEGTVRCGEGCVDVGVDPAHCGGCDAACDAGDPCVQSGCDAADVVHLLITGQSLSNGYSSAVVSAIQPFGNLSFNTGVRAGAAGLTSLIPLIETFDGAHGETIASGMANLAGSLWEAAGFDSRTFLVSAHGADGFNYSKVKKGTPAYTTGMAQVMAGQALATSLGQTYEVRAMAVIHGESDHIDYPPEGNVDYAANLLEWRADYEADVQAMTGQATPVRFFYCQMSSWTAYGGAHSLIPEQQRRVALENPDRFYLVTPKYFLPYTDGVHLTGEGTRWLGEYYGKALGRVYLDGASWAPLGPTGATIDGVNVVVDFAVPAPPLVFDEVLVSNPGSFGFTFTDGSGDPPGISSVALTGPAQVTVTLAGPPGPTARLGYAALGQPGVPAGPMTGARGNLRDSDATPSLSGLPLYNWAVHFELALN